MNSQTSLETRPVGFVGAGSMGEPMIRNLARSGVEMHVVDTDGRRLEAFAGEPGVVIHGSLSDLARCTTTICMLPTSEAVVDVVASPLGLLHVLAAGSVIVDMGSSRPRSTVALAKQAQGAGVDLVDAPVSGGVSRARSATLTIMFGGTGEQLEACRPLLARLGSKVVHVGPVGAGHAMKALNNVSSAISLTAAVEILRVGRSLGLDPEVMLDVLNGSTGRTYATEHKVREFILSGTYASGFAFHLMLKDLDTAMDMAHNAGVPVGLGERCWELWKAAAPALPESADHTEIARFIRGPDLTLEGR